MTQNERLDYLVEEFKTDSVRKRSKTRATVLTAISAMCYGKYLSDRGQPCDVILVICMFVNFREAALFARF